MLEYTGINEGLQAGEITKWKDSDTRTCFGNSCIALFEALTYKTVIFIYIL